MNSLKVRKGSSIAVFGTGAVGLAAVMAARLVGADPIIGADIVPKKLKLSLELGATHIIDCRHDDAGGRIKAITGKGVDFVLDTTGDAGMSRLAREVLNPGGIAADVTGASSARDLPGGKKVISIIQGNAVPQIFIPELIRLYMAGLFPFDRLVKFYEFNKINRAIADSRQGRAVKAVVTMGKGLSKKGPAIAALLMV
jgi:aryl-alcohol dehydrogenase